MCSYYSLVVLFVTVYCVDAQDFIWSTPASGNGSCGEVAETSTPGSLGIAVSALIPSFNKRIVSYNMTNQPTGAELGFTVGSLGIGEITLQSGDIDFEATSSIIFTLIAIDDSTPALSGTATCTVNVTDINDNVPMFTDNQSKISIADNAIAGATIGVFTASDADMTSPNNDITAYIITDGDLNNDMAMAVSTGTITVASGKTLQRTATSTYTLTVTAEDGGVPALTGTGTLTVCVGGCMSGGGVLRENTCLIFAAISLVIVGTNKHVL